MIDWNYILNQVATVAFDIIYFGAIIGTIVVIILDNRNPVKTLAWILVLTFALCGYLHWFWLSMPALAVYSGWKLIEIAGDSLLLNRCGAVS